MQSAKIALAGLVIGLAGCQTSMKSRTTCEDDVTELRVAIFEVNSFLEALRPQIQEGYEALDRCENATETCAPARQLDQARTLRRDHRAASSRFQSAVNTWTPEACISYIQTMRINPPKPESYKGYFFSLDETEQQIEELISEFDKKTG